MNSAIFKKLKKEIKNIIIITAFGLTGLFLADYFGIVEHLIYVIYISGFVLMIISFVIFIKFLINWFKIKRKFSEKASELKIGLMHMSMILFKSKKLILKAIKLLWPFVLKTMKLFWPFILKFFNR